MPRSTDMLVMEKDGKRVRVVRSAFEGHWQHHGWKLASDTPVSPVGSVPDEDELPDDESEESETE